MNCCYLGSDMRRELRRAHPRTTLLNPDGYDGIAHAPGTNVVQLLDLTCEMQSRKATSVKMIDIALDVPFDRIRRPIATVAVAIGVTRPHQLHCHSI